MDKLLNFGLYRISIKYFRYLVILITSVANLINTKIQIPYYLFSLYIIV